MAVTIKKAGSDVGSADGVGVRIYRFGYVNDVESSACSKEKFGGKGANLMLMAGHGLPVPSGFTIPCKVSVRYLNCLTNASKLGFNHQLKTALKSGVQYLTEAFGYMPLVSVRSGARVSMPGMMDTILNVGITTATLPFWAEKLGERAALDSYRRFIQMYASVALEIPHHHFESALTAVRQSEGVAVDSEISVTGLKSVIHLYKAVLGQHKVVLPDTVEEQLFMASLAVFRSWNNDRAKEYRKIHGYPADWGTAVNVQAMVFGNLNDQSATGVLFTRDPSTGTNKVTGEFLVNAQGEDVVAGIRTPEPFDAMAGWNLACYDQLKALCGQLEDLNRDMQDIEFTVQDGKVYLLQTRNGKRSAAAAFKVAHDLAVEGKITPAEAVSRVTKSQLSYLLTDRIDPSFTTPPNLIGIPAGGGLVKGLAVFTAGAAINCKASSVPCILVRKETDPDDLAGMNASVGILTSTGGLTSHAAVVARGLNKTCVVGATDLVIEDEAAAIIAGTDVDFSAGDDVTITMDGLTGYVWVGVEVPVLPGVLPPEASAILGWAMEGRPSLLTLKVGDHADFILSTLDHCHGGAVLDVNTIVEGRLDQPAQEDLVRISKFFTVLFAAMVQTDKSVLVRVRATPTLLPKSDGLFESMFGVNGYPMDLILTSCLYKALTSVGHQSLLPLLKIEIDKGSYPSDPMWVSMVSKIEAMGYCSGTKAKNIKAILDSASPVDFDPNYVASVFGDVETFNLVVSLLEAHKGQTLISSTAPVEPLYWFNALGE